MKRSSSLASMIVLCFLFACAGSLRAQDGLQFNVPYACNDGATYVVHKCVTGPKGEMCFYQAEGESERYNRREAVVSQMTKTCKVKSGPSPAAAAAQSSSDLQLNTPYQCAGELTLTAVQCHKQNGQDYCLVKVEQNGKFLMEVPKPQAEIATQLKACQAGTTFNPPYLAEFPKASDVVQAMVTGNPKDNVTRAMGALYQLTEIINILSAQRGTSGYSPDEKKLLDNYSKMQSDVVQAAAKILPGQQFNVATNPYHFSRSDPKFGFEGIPVWTTFLSPSLQARFAQIVGGNDPHYIASVEQQKRTAMQQIQTNIAIAQSEQNARKDAGSVATRRCLESGRSETECLGEGIKVGLADLAGENHPVTALVATNKDPGLRLTGLYSAENFYVRFDQAAAGVKCGSLLEVKLPYSVERSANQVLVKVPIHPEPLVLSFKPDGKLFGPGLIDVAGRVVAGRATDTASTSYETQTQTTTTQRQVSANDAPNYSADQVHRNGMEYSVDNQTTSSTEVPTTVHNYSVPTVGKTERCNVSVLPPTAATSSISSTLTQVLGSQASKSANTAPGLRLNGTYSVAGGLKIEFRDDSATLECGTALSSEGYAVVPEGSQLVVKFQHGAGPLSLVLQPNGTLTGSGSVDVNGRKIYRSQTGDIAYTPQTARCTLGTLTPK
ncbi:MAG TPA: hypothetical protein VOA41_07345 [Candidatus Dormibacteraeota bacterium]|nr:hypothetical protein [Candidatus Dormibacteraeota bacterium]